MTRKTCPARKNFFDEPRPMLKTGTNVIAKTRRIFQSYHSIGRPERGIGAACFTMLTAPLEKILRSGLFFSIFAWRNG